MICTHTIRNKVRPEVHPDNRLQGFPLVMTAQITTINLLVSNHSYLEIATQSNGSEWFYRCIVCREGVLTSFVFQ